MPPLRNRGKDIHLLFKKFSSDFAEKYKTPPVKLTEDAVLAYKIIIGLAIFDNLKTL